MFSFSFSFSFSFFFTLSFFYFNVKNGVTPLYIAAQEGYEQIVQFLLEKGNPNVDLPTKVLLLIVFFLFLFLFQFLIFLFFFYLKVGTTPLLVAAQEGHEQIVQLLLEKGNPNVDFANEVILLIISFSFFFFFFFFSLSHFSILM